MEGFEPPASCSQSRRATNCATPGYSVVLSGWADTPKPLGQKGYSGNGQEKFLIFLRKSLGRGIAKNSEKH